VPVKLADEEMVWPFTRPEVIAPRVELPAFKAVAKRLVEEAVVAKKLVVVALVEVDQRAVKFWRVVEERATRLVVVAVPFTRKLPLTVEEAFEMKPMELEVGVMYEPTCFQALNWEA
jgi:hypothetical protein